MWMLLGRYKPVLDEDIQKGVGGIPKLLAPSQWNINQSKYSDFRTHEKLVLCNAFGV